MSTPRYLALVTTSNTLVKTCSETMHWFLEGYVEFICFVVPYYRYRSVHLCDRHIRWLVL